MKTLNISTLQSAVAGSAAAFRCRQKLDPAGGEGSKVFPPTYSDGPYATEDRVITVEEDGKLKTVRVPTVLLDSVQSQANRMELALLQGLREGKLSFPLIEVDFSGCTDDDPLKDLSDLVEINSLTAPHRVADAILRDSLLNGINFRNSDVGKGFGDANIRNATVIYQICPTALLFGVWDSTGPKGGLGAKFQRAIASEIVAFEVEGGKKPSSRLDPFAIEKAAGPVFRTTDCGWTISPEDPKILKKGNKPVLYAKDSKGNDVEWNGGSDQEQGKPSVINHGNITPSLKKESSNQLNPGGFTIAHALETTVISLPALRRLCFRIEAPNPNQATANDAGRVVLAALGLAAIAWKQRAGYDLRSGCLLIPQSEPIIELLSPGKSEEFTLSLDDASKLLAKAVAEAAEAGLKWKTDPIKLDPSPNLQALIRKSRAKTAEAPVEN